MRILILGVLLVFSSALAGRNSEIRFDNITTSDGLSHSSVNKIIQDELGFIWIGTKDGLNRYDGYGFSVFKASLYDSLTLSNNNITALCYDNRGFIWVGTEWGLNIYDIEKGEFTPFSDIIGSSASISNSAIQTIYKDNMGYVWVGTKSEGLARLFLTGKDFSTINIDQYLYRKSDKNTILSNDVTCIVQDGSGFIWVGTSNGLNMYDTRTNGFIHILSDTIGENSLTSAYITDIIEDDEGDMWAGTRRGLNKITIDETDLKNINISAHHFYHEEHNPNSISNNYITDLFQDSDGILWIATHNGLNNINLKGEDYAYENYKFIQYYSSSIIENSLIHNEINNVFEDESGIIWIASDRGINKFDKLKQKLHYYALEGFWDNSNHFVNVNAIKEDLAKSVWVGTEKGLACIDRVHRKTYYSSTNRFKEVFSILVDVRDQVWIGTDKGLFKVYIDGAGKFQYVKNNSVVFKKTQNAVTSLLQDYKGNYWVGQKSGLTILNENGRLLAEYEHDLSAKNSIAQGAINCLYQDSLNRIFIGTNGGGLCITEITEDYKNLLFTTFKQNVGNALNNNFITAVMEHPKGIFWIGTYGGGVNRFDSNTRQFMHYDESDGLSNNIVYGILRDGEGSIWISTNRGLSKLDRFTEKIRTFYKSDGLRSDEFNLGAYFHSNTGELYFGGIKGFTAFFPEEIEPNDIPPKIVLTGLYLSNQELKVGDGNTIITKQISSTKEIVIPHSENSITLQYAGLHYTSPANNTYAYKLEGFNEEWQDAGTKREVTFTNLDPGTYTFNVRAANSDGKWSTEVASLKININPPFWMTWWFRTFAAAIGMIIIMAVYYSRIAIVKTQKRVLEYKVQQRTEEVLRNKAEIEEQKEKLEIEKNRTEQLLLNILPAETAKELIATGKAAPRHYRMVTVMFADFKGFTKIAERMRPAELVAELDASFNSFDDIVDNYNIEKIKTSGDAYMCAGGVPIRNKTNPVDCVLAAMKIQSFMLNQLKEREGTDAPAWELRIGIHTGEIIAGVVGKKKFAYDIWGDTVNTASRMESSSQAGHINISGTTYRLVKDYFDCEYRGKIPVKHKGDIDMYFVKGIKPELSKNGKGFEPNVAFQELHHFNVYSKLNYNKVKQFVLKKLEEELPKNLYYHGPHHTRDVIRAAERIGRAEGLDSEQVMLVKLAALFHDAGFLNKYWDNEPEGVKIAQEILPNFGFTDSQIEIIEGMILATRIPQNPTNHLEQVICDADLDYLGRDDFNEISQTLQQEFLDYGGIKNADDWDPIQVKFLESHKYYTAHAKKTRREKKLQHLAEVRVRLEARESS